MGFWEFGLVTGSLGFQAEFKSGYYITDVKVRVGCRIEGFRLRVEFRMASS